MPRLLRRILAANDRFWFRKQSTLTLGLFRIAFGIFILLMIASSFPNWERFYGASGAYPLPDFIDASGGFWGAASSSVLALSASPLLLWSVFGMGVFASACFALGLYTRLSTLISFIIWGSIYHRNFILINGQDQVVMMLLFFCCFAPLGNSLSIDNILRNKYHPSTSRLSYRTRQLKSVWSWRLMQVSITLIYFFSGPSKFLDGVEWRDGTAIYYVSLSDRWFRFNQVDFLHNEILSVYFTYGALLIECLFPLLIWFRKTRLLMLSLIALLHASIVVLMSEYVLHFNIVMLISFILFLPTRTTQKLIDLFSRKNQFLSTPHLRK